MEFLKRQTLLLLSDVLYTSIEMVCKLSEYCSRSSRPSGNFGSCKAFVNILDLGLVQIEMGLNHN